MKVIAMIDSFKGVLPEELNQAALKGFPVQWEKNQSPSQMVEKEQWLRYLLPMEDSINP